MTWRVEWTFASGEVDSRTYDTKRRAENEYNTARKVGHHARLLVMTENGPSLLRETNRPLVTVAGVEVPTTVLGWDGSVTSRSNHDTGVTLDLAADGGRIDVDVPTSEGMSGIRRGLNELFQSLYPGNTLTDAQQTMAEHVIANPGAIGATRNRREYENRWVSGRIERPERKHLSIVGGSAAQAHHIAADLGYHEHWAWQFVSEGLEHRLRGLSDHIVIIAGPLDEDMRHYVRLSRPTLTLEKP